MSTTTERLAGIDEALPEGEAILWQGAPAVRAVARHVFYQRAVALYLLGLVALVLVPAINARGVSDALRVAPLLLTVVGSLLLGIEVVARLVARTTRYVITERRIVMQVGIALPMSINIPLRLVQDAGLRVFGDGSGVIKLGLDPSVRLAWLALFPHARFLRLKHPEPLLLGLTDPHRVGAVLQQVARKDGITTPEAPRSSAARSTETVALA